MFLLLAPMTVIEAVLNQSVAFSALDIGTGGLDIAHCTRITLNGTVHSWREDQKVYPDIVIIVLWTEHALNMFKDSIIDLPKYL